MIKFENFSQSESNYSFIYSADINIDGNNLYHIKTYFGKPEIPNYQVIEYFCNHPEPKIGWYKAKKVDVNFAINEGKIIWDKKQKYNEEGISDFKNVGTAFIDKILKLRAFL